ncbi:MAG TPA: hypothetical protein VG965_00455 [Patescibacteria group bacterium]|nr:hypothetical protein [Patescibacteria group bacterium]
MNEQKTTDPNQEQRTGSWFHQEAETAREQGRYLDALVACDQAIYHYGQEANTVKFAEAHASRSLAKRRIFAETGDGSWLISAKGDAQSAYDIMHAAGGRVGVAVPLYSLGKIQEELGDSRTAIISYSKAIEILAEAHDDPQSRPAFIAEMWTRFDIVKYNGGKLDRFEEDFKGILDDENEPQYNRNVLATGALIHMSEVLLKKGQKEDARKFADRAKQIIDSDPALTERKKDYDRLMAKIAA